MISSIKFHSAPGLRHGGKELNAAGAQSEQDRAFIQNSPLTTLKKIPLNQAVHFYSLAFIRKAISFQIPQFSPQIPPAFPLNPPVLTGTEQ